MKYISILLFLMFVSTVHGLTAQEVSSFCHCDITASFCDFGCCCDKDCSSSIPTQCYNRLSTTFCLNTSYYYKIDSTLTQPTSSPNCFYYNETTTLQQQVTISQKQIQQITSKYQKNAPLPSNQAAMDFGYRIGNVLMIANKNSFNFVDASGNCLTTGVNAFEFKIRWRVNSDFACTGTSNSVNMFNDIFNKNVNAFSGSSEKQVLIPSPDAAYNQAIVYIFIGRFGSSGTQFIQDIRTVGKVAGKSGVRYLKIRFVDPQIDLEQQQSQPSFFPQIPYDIFYPIYQIAYSF